MSQMATAHNKKTKPSLPNNKENSSKTIIITKSTPITIKLTKQSFYLSFLLYKMYKNKKRKEKRKQETKPQQSK